MILKYFKMALLSSTLFFSAALSAGASESHSELVSIIVHMKNDQVIPRNFRMTADPIGSHENINLTGFQNLNASASGQFSAKSLEKVFETIPNDKIYIVDLRQESHGFLNGIAVSWWGEKNWANQNRTPAEIEADERDKLASVQDKDLILIIGNKPKVVHVDESISEEELVHSLGFWYQRIYAPDHLKPTDENVDHFIQFVRNIPEDSWLHFHCAAGMGRSSTFMVMYDMMRNAKNVSYEDILKRQNLIGGKDFITMPTESEEGWKYEGAIERIEFLENFYHFCLENQNLEKSWSSWSSQQL